MLELSLRADGLTRACGNDVGRCIWVAGRRGLLLVLVLRVLLLLLSVLLLLLGVLLLLGLRVVKGRWRGARILWVLEVGLLRVVRVVVERRRLGVSVDVGMLLRRVKGRVCVHWDSCNRQRQ